MRDIEGIADYIKRAFYSLKYEFKYTNICND